MWWRLALLAAVSLAIAFVLLAPMATMTVHVDLPPAPSGATYPADADSIGRGVSAVAAVVGGALFVVYTAVVLWIGRWIVRRYRRRP